MKKIVPTIFATILVFVTLALYVLTIRGVNHNVEVNQIKNGLDQAAQPLELSPERGRFALVMSLANRGRFDLGPELADAVYPDVGWYQGKFYILFAPGISLMALPFYLLGHQYGLSQVFSFYISSLFAVASAIVLYKIQRNIFSLPAWASLFGCLAFCFGSISWAYAVSLYQHLATTFFILMGIYGSWKYSQDTRFSWVYAVIVWLLYALAISVDYPNILLFMPVMVYLGLSAFKVSQNEKKIQVRFRPSLILTSILFVLVTAVHGYYNLQNFGGWTNLSGGLIDYKTIKENNLLASQTGQNKIEEIENKIQPTKFFSEEDFPFGFYTLLWSQDRGFLLYTPLFALSILGILSLIKKIDFPQSVMVASAITILFLYSSWGDPWGGWAYGPRYLIPVFALMSPFLSVWIMPSKNKINSFLRKLLALILFCYSSGVALLGALTTNAIPPKPEADFLHMPFNYIRNFPFISDNHSSSFVFNYFVKNYLSLFQYYSLILTFVILIAMIFLFVLPLYEKK